MRILALLIALFVVPVVGVASPLEAELPGAQLRGTAGHPRIRGATVHEKRSRAGLEGRLCVGVDISTQSQRR